MNHDVGVVQPVARHQCKQLRIARPSTHEGDQADRTRRSCGLVDQRAERFARALLALPGIAAGAAPEEILGPERPSHASGGNVLAPAPERLSDASERPQRNRQLGFEGRLEVPREHRRCPFGCDRHRDRIAVDDGRRDEVTAIEIVDDVNGDSTPPGQCGGACILCWIVARAIEERCAIEVAGFHAALLVTQRAFAVPGQDSRIRVGAEYGDLGVALQQQAQLGHRRLPGAGDRDLPARETEKDREMLHRDRLLPIALDVGA